MSTILEFSCKAYWNQHEENQRFAPQGRTVASLQITLRQGKLTRVLCKTEFEVEGERLFALQKELRSAYVSKLPPPWRSFAHSIRGRATKESSNRPPSPPKKDILATFCLGLNCRVLITPKACISSKHSFGYHQGESLVYHHCERRYSLRLMIYTFGDDIHDCVVMIYHCFRNG